MHILLTTIICRSGLLTHVWDLANGLSKQGIKVTVAIKYSQELPKKLFPPLLRKIQGTPYFFYSTTPKLLRLCAAHKVELIHAHSPATMTSSLNVARTLSIPLVVTLHSVDDWEKKYGNVLQNSSRIIAVGPSQAECVKTYHSKTHLIPNGVDLNYFKPNTEQEAPDSLKILWFGRTHGSMTRGVKALDRAIGLLKEEDYPITAKMVGTAQGYIPQNMEHLGWIDDPLPYLQWGQLAFGHGRALREAIACGNVGFLIGCGYGGLISAEWFNKERAFLDAFPEYNLPPAEPRQIARDIKEVSAGPPTLSDLQKEARKIAENTFDLVDMIDRTVKVYSECCVVERV